VLVRSCGTSGTVELPVARKCMETNRAVSFLTPSTRPIVRVRVPHTEETHWRFEVTCGWRWPDPNTLAWQLAATALVLYGLSHDVYSACGWELAHPLVSAATIMGPPDG
jgi:hypothetical protein